MKDQMNIDELNSLCDKVHAVALNPKLLENELLEIHQGCIANSIKYISTSCNFLPIIKNFNSKTNNIKINTLIGYPFGDIPALLTSA